ncbi:MAG: response regulator [Planctomycetes bacterium]|nr:response regulator [Planctomycetota bacterium]
MTQENPVNILVVDDEPTGLVALEAVLIGPGRNVVKARSGREALRHVLSTDFAVILLDVQMPGMDGFETAALIRERERSRATPIIFLTATMRNEAAAFKGYEVGAVDYLFKPVVPEILRCKVEVFVELARKTAQLRVLNEQLEDQATQLSAANGELEAFSHSVSHDLQAPIRQIGGFAQALSRECEQMLPEIGRDYLQRIDAATKRMTELVHDLLGLARVARAEIRRIPLDLSDISRSVAAELRKSAPRREVEFLVASPLMAHGDPGLLRIAIENLMGNAWKYSGRNATATIEVGSMIGDDGAEIYYVRDDGVGFDMAYADKLFAPFQRLHSSSEFEGTGIGLATVQRIVHRHGGRIWAESAPQKGATFYFTLR